MTGSTRESNTTTPPRRLWRVRRTPVLIGLAVLLISIGGWALRQSSAVDDRLLVVDESGAILLLDPDTGAVMFELPDATATPDRSALLTTRPAGENTVLESRDPLTGTVTGSTTLDREGLTVRTVSPQGHAVALMPGARGGGIYDPEARKQTDLTVSYLDERPARTFELPGNFEPEMFSFDETGLFVIEFVPPEDPDSYYVRRLDLATGALSDTGAPQVGLNPKMRGKARASVLHPHGDQLFTLYTLPQTGEPVFDPDAPGDVPLYAFVHVIDLKENWSHCIFLPQPVGTVAEAGVGMGISPAGDELVVADPATATLVRIDSRELTVVGTSRVEQLRDPAARGSVAVAADGTIYLGAGDRVLEVTRPDLEVARVWSQDSGVSTISVSASDDELRVGGRGAITILDRRSGVETALLQAPGRGTVTLLGPPRGSVTEFPLECAC